MGPVACSVIEGVIRVHSAPKVASDSIARAMQTLKGFSRERVSQPGPEYRFGLVRHPLDRLVSGWAYFCKDGRLINQPQMWELGYRHNMAFSDFLDVALANHWRNQHTRMQIDFIGPQPFDRIARFENLNAEWARLVKMFPTLNPIGHHNRSGHRSWEDYFSGDDAARALDIYAEDLALYEGAE